MRSPHEIISDEEIIRVHGHANFGDMSPREVVNDGVRKYAIGYTGGHTQLCILMEHGLITKPKPGKYSANLTQKGKRYARAVSVTHIDTSQAAVAAALEAAARVMGERQALISREQVADLIRALITQPQHDALAAHVAAEVAKARDAALVEAANEVEGIEGYDNIGGEHPLVSMILALRDKPAPAVTPKIEVKFTWAKGDEEFWVHLKSPDGKSAGFNLGNPKGMIATALLRAIAGGGDE